MLFAHLKRILRLDRLRLGGPNGTRDEFHLAATAQNLRKLAKRIPMPLPKLAGEAERPHGLALALIGCDGLRVFNETLQEPKRSGG